jgi:ribose/xylose/arabinose/galactoside ABC-type transport system permease subunit
VGYVAAGRLNNMTNTMARIPTKFIVLATLVSVAPAAMAHDGPWTEHFTIFWQTLVGMPPAALLLAAAALATIFMARRSGPPDQHPPGAPHH